MYDWRKMTQPQREEALRLRKALGHPWHGPPHREGESSWYHMTAACYEHASHIGISSRRMAVFEHDLLDTLSRRSECVSAWCVLPNHYHALIRSEHILDVLVDLGRLHGRTSHAWNGEEEARGRKCWHRSVERAMRSERHRWATLNYIHHNPVYHGYVSRWQNWPFSSAGEYLRDVGHDAAIKTWKEYPILDYGKGWDDPDPLFGVRASAGGGRGTA